MQNNPLLLTIIVGAIALIVGAVVGYVGALIESRLNKSLDDAREITDPDDPKYEQYKPIPNVDEHDILKVTIDPALKLRLSLDGVSVEPDGLTPEQRARLVNAIVQIRPWIDGKSLPVTTAPVTYLAPSAPIAPLSSGFPVQPMSSAAAPVVAKGMDLRRGFRTLLESDVKKPEPLLTNNIVSLIDEVLQKKLETSPLSAKRIRIEEGHTGEVVVYVGSARYIGIDSVPDSDIRAIIQASIKEWNDK